MIFDVDCMYIIELSGATSHLSKSEGYKNNLL